MTKFEDIIEVLALFADNDVCDNVWWRTDTEYAPVTFLINCNDFFTWAADAESIESEDLPLLRQTFADCATLEREEEMAGVPIPDRSWFVLRAHLLFVARKRKLRPWQRKLDNPDIVPPKMKHLFSVPEWEQWCP